MPATARSRAAAAGPRPRRESLRALLVDDSPDNAEPIVAELRRARFELDALRVETRNQLAAALAEREWDIVLRDDRMPALIPVEALGLVGELAPGQPLVLVSARSAPTRHSR